MPNLNSQSQKFAAIANIQMKVLKKAKSIKRKRLPANEKPDYVWKMCNIEMKIRYNNPRKEIWDIMILILAVFNGVIVPLELVFHGAM